jgi:hypothetical protein
VRGLALALAFSFAGCGHLDARVHELSVDARIVAASVLPGTPARLVTAHDEPPHLRLHRVRSVSALDRAERVELPLAPAEVVAAPERGDELFVSYRGHVRVDHARRGPDGAWTLTTLFDGGRSSLPTALTAADLDHDGRTDVVLVQPSPPRIVLVFPSADHDQSKAESMAVGVDQTPRLRPDVVTADLDADGNLDVVASIASGGPRDPIPDHLRAYRNGSHGRLADETWYRVSAPRRVLAGDLDHDGAVDALVVGHRHAWLLRGLQHGWLGESSRVPGRHDLVDATLADVDGDGNLDLVGIERRRARLHVALGVGNGDLGPAHRVDLGGRPASVRVVDLGGGAVEALVFEPGATTVKSVDLTPRSAHRRNDAARARASAARRP